MSTPVLRFEQFEFDEERFELRHSGTPVTLEPKPFQVLDYLLRHRDRVVSKHELLDAVWPDTAVSDSSLSFALRRIREALGDDARAPRFVQTHWGRGYRFIAEVESA